MFDLSSMYPGTIIPTSSRHGTFLTLTGDTHGPGGHLRHYGEFCEQEIELLGSLVNDHSFAIEVGANIGTHAIPLVRRMSPFGAYVAYEPQPLVAILLEANLALNACYGVNLRIKAAGKSTGYCSIPIIDYNSIGNSGAVSLVAGNRDDMNTPEGDTSREAGFVPVEPLDSVNWGRCVDLIKIDAEEMEEDVLQGALNLISKDQPIIYFEEHQLAHSGNQTKTASTEILRSMNYDLYGHITSMHREVNFLGQRVPLFADFGGSHNILAIPRDNRSVNESMIDHFNLLPLL